MLALALQKKNKAWGTYRSGEYNVKQTIKTESACILDEDAIDKFSEKYEYDSDPNNENLFKTIDDEENNKKEDYMGRTKNRIMIFMMERSMNQKCVEMLRRKRVRVVEEQNRFDKEDQNGELTDGKKELGLL